jgi:hypothetical protein
MFKHYTTIDDVMAGNGRALVMDQLNITPLYTRAVASLRYTQIGIVVLNNGREISRYVSHNGVDGRITSIEKDFEMDDPDVVVKVEGSTLVEMLHNIEEIKAHPFRSFFDYRGSFRPARGWKDYKKVIHDLPHLVVGMFGNRSPDKVEEHAQL